MYEHEQLKWRFVLEGTDTLPNTQQEEMVFKEMMLFVLNKMSSGL